MKRILITCFAITSLLASAQKDLLQSGPMMGYAQMREAVIWVQTTKPASVYALYNDKKGSETEIYSTDTILTKEYYANTAKLILNKVEPGRHYSYRLYINGQKIERSYPFVVKIPDDWRYRKDPPEFNMALGSCTYINEGQYDRPGNSYGGEYEIFKSVLDKKPDAMLWLGDNIYLRPADWFNRTGYIKRYTHTRSLPELQELWSACNHFAIWDDHDFGPNNATGSWYQKDLALEMFELFWANPTFGYSDLPGTMSAFTYSDVDFILMDNRFNRTENYNKGEKHIFGRKQSDRLIDLLKFSRAPFKVVATGGQFLNTAQVYENHSNYNAERDYILRRINEEGIKGVVFISGDRHHSEVSKHKLSNGDYVYEFTVSPLTSGPNTNVTETNETQVEGSLIQERNFAIMNVTGKFRERVLSIQFYNVKGKKIFNYTIEAQSIYKR